METNEKRQVEMSAAEAEAFARFKEEQERKARAQRRKDNREAYAQIVDEQVAASVERLQALSQSIREVKEEVFRNFREVLAMKADVMGMTQEGQRSHTFTTSDGSMRLTLGVNCIDGYRDTVEDGIAMVKRYISGLAKDEETRALVDMILRLLARDQTGNLKASRVLQLRKMAEKVNDETFLEGVRIIEESYQPTETRQYIRAERKDERGWRIIPLSVTDAGE